MNDLFVSVDDRFWDAPADFLSQPATAIEFAVIVESIVKKLYTI